MSNIAKKIDVKIDDFNAISVDIGADAGNIDFADGKNLEQKMGEVNQTLQVKADLVDGRIPYSQLPESAMELKGTWNANTNTPTLQDGEGDNGDFYIVNVAGTWNDIHFNVNDRIVYDGSTDTWVKLTGGEVLSVNGRIGDVILSKNDIGMYVLRNLSISETTHYVINGDFFKANSLIDIYYADNYDIEPTYTQAEGSLTIDLEEIPSETISFAIKVVN